MSSRMRHLALLLAAVVAVAACGDAADAADRRHVAALDPSPTASAVPGEPSGPPAAAEPTPTPTPTPGPTPTPTPAPEPSPSAEPTPAPEAAPNGRPAEGRSGSRREYAMDLYERGDFVAQYTFEWCVGASIQMMLNLGDTKESRSRARQRAFWELARDHSFSPFGGANPRGWTAALNELGLGPYELVSLPTFDEALRVAARAMRRTKRPVGLVMWRGRHAWVMSGFTSKGDPRRDDFRVTGVRVLDPLYPHGSGLWGSSPRPNQLISPKRLARQFVLRDSSRVNLGVPPGYLLVVPVKG